MNIRYTAILGLLLSSGFLTAQNGVLLAEEFLPVGSEFTLRTVQNLAAMDTTTGTSVTWNLTDAIPTGPTYTTSILAPAATTWGGTFPSANYCLYESSVLRTSYFELTTESFTRIGFYRNELGIYSDPQIEYVFPLQFGSTHSDTWANNTVSFPGTLDYTVIGTGTLLLPSGTFPDVLLLRVDLVNVLPYRQYLWVDAGTGAYLAIYATASLFGPATGQILTSMVVGIEEPSSSIDLRIHAAAGGQLPITYSATEALRFRISDACGRLLTEGNLPVSAEARTTWLDVQALRPGLHLLELAGDRSRHTVRFVLE